MDQIDIDLDEPTTRKRGRPRKWHSEEERRAHEQEKRRARKRTPKPQLTHEQMQAAAASLLVEQTRARVDRLATASTLNVRDDDLKEVAQEFPCVAEGFQYARDVLSGLVPACQWVRLACERHARDFARLEDETFPYTFDADRAERVLKVVQRFREIKGPRAGRRFRFAAWQRFIVASLFGWVHRVTRMRRFRSAFVAVPRGNGKSSLAAPIGLYMLALDGEGGAEIYAAAVTRDQAKIVFSAAQHMARTEPVFLSRFGVSVQSHVITQESSASIFKALSRDAQALDGLNVHAAILDELAAHKTREVFDVLVTATGKRLQPLMLSITTAGQNQAGIGYEQWRYTLRVLLQEIEDETFFGIIYTIDESDDWREPASWVKANPNWGVSVNPDVIANLAARAAKIGSQQSAFKQKHLNIWTNAAVGWMNMVQWHAAADPTLRESDFNGEPCVIGIDLASKVDLAARVKLFVRQIDGVSHYYAFAQFYLPDAAISEGRVASYQTWEADGWIVATPGEVLDFDRILTDILDDAAHHQITDVAYDPWQALQMATTLDAKAIPVIEYRPTVANFSPAMKEIDALVRQGRFHHSGNPVLAWNVSCVEVMEDYKGNIYPRKDRDNPQVKIDGLVALLMAMGRRLDLDARDAMRDYSLKFV